MSKSDMVELEGIVTAKLPGTKFTVKLMNGTEVTAYLSGRLRQNFIRILVGDKVTLEMSPYDLTKGKITWRNN